MKHDEKNMAKVKVYMEKIKREEAWCYLTKNPPRFDMLKIADKAVDVCNHKGWLEYSEEFSTDETRTEVCGCCLGHIYTPRREQGTLTPQRYVL